MQNYKQQVTDFFNSRTAYDQEGTFHPLLADLLLECVDLKLKQKVLDVATGTGLIAIPAAQKVGAEGYVVGVDISPRMLNQARQKIAPTSLHNIEFIETDVEYLDFESNSFDIFFCSSALVYLADIPTAFQHWYRFLKPGGIVAFSCFSETSFIAPMIIKACAKNGISLLNINAPLGMPEKCYNLLKQAGLKNIKVKTEQLGEYLNLGDRKLAWNGRQWFHPQGNPLLNLLQQQTEQLQTAYTAEIEQLVTNKGVWYDVTTFFVVAQ